jgi:Lauroyl/myristoyl acyltransferase
MAQVPFQRKLRWQLEALGVRLLLLALRGRSHRSMGRGIAQAHRLARPWLRRRHTTAIANLTRVYGEQLSQGQREAIAEQSINSFFLSCLESIIQPVDASLISAEGEGSSNCCGCTARARG